MNTMGRLALTAFLTTAVRVIGQLLLPAGEQTVLVPSVFAQNSAMPAAFTIYGLLAYGAIAAMYLPVRDGIRGGRAARGLKYGLSLCAVWTVYLWEPLPHVAPLDMLLYPLADGAALLALGLCCGLLFPGEAAVQRAPLRLLPALAVAACFVAGRFLQYAVFDIYSSFDARPWAVALWTAGAGLCVGLALAWLRRAVRVRGRARRAALLGLSLFGCDLLLFNFFMPLVFDADIPDLLLRTLIDALAAFAGCMVFGEEGEAAR